MGSIVKRLRFYATGDDLATVAAQVEQKIPIRYVLTGNFTARPKTEYIAANDFPNFGTARYEQAIACDAYLVLPKSQLLDVRELDGDWGRRRYLVDQLVNPGTVILRPGGVHRPGVLIQGEISTVHEDDDAQTIMRAFQGALREQFVKVESCWLGGQAERILDSGKRLTVDARHDWHDFHRPG